MKLKNRARETALVKMLKGVFHNLTGAQKLANQRAEFPSGPIDLFAPIQLNDVYQSRSDESGMSGQI